MKRLTALLAALLLTSCANNATVTYEVAHVPDFYAQHKSLHLEANLYVVSDGEHLWQAAVGIEETQEMDKLLHGFIVALVDQLKQDQLVR